MCVRQPEDTRRQSVGSAGNACDLPKKKKTALIDRDPDYNFNHVQSVILCFDFYTVV